MASMLNRISPTMPPPPGFNAVIVTERPVRAFNKPVLHRVYLWVGGENGGGRWVPESQGGRPIPDEGLRVGHVRDPGAWHSYFVAEIKLVLRTLY